MTRDESSIELAAWLKTAPGRYLLAWEQARLDQEVADTFGFHALQLGLPELDGLRANRMPHRWVASDAMHLPTPRVGSPLSDAAAATFVSPSLTSSLSSSLTPPLSASLSTPQKPPAKSPPAPALHCDFDALPLPDASVDLVVLPHALELALDPHQTLREVERVLVPEGRVVIVGFNPTSLWGLRQRFGHMRRGLGFGRGSGLYLPRAGDFIGYWRARDWLRLLGFEVEAGRFGCWRPPLESERWLQRFAWMDRVGDRWWPVLGAVYVICAVKRVRGMRLIGMARQEQRTPALSAPAVAASRQAEAVMRTRAPRGRP
jgi:SAM-dependent methyltransferase